MRMTNLVQAMRSAERRSGMGHRLAVRCQWEARRQRNRLRRVLQKFDQASEQEKPAHA